MNEKLIKLLGLEPNATEETILGAVAALKQAAAATKTSARELAIIKMMNVTGCIRADAEHTVDQRAKEEAARKAKTKGEARK